MGVSSTGNKLPQAQLWQTIGHDWAVSLLSRAVAGERVAHAYLLTGPDGIGKRHLARRLAAMLNCEAPAAAPCGLCSACRRIAQDAHPDVSLIAPEEGRTKIAQVRAVQHELSLSPYEGRWRVAILLDFDLATTEAANALLKTLEEPPSRAIIILTATDASLLLPTVVSRCQTVPMRAVAREEIAHYLQERWELDAARAELLARLSAGRIGWAISAAHDPGLLAERQSRLAHLQELLGQGRAERIMAAEGLAQDAERLPDLLRLWQTWWRDVMLIAGGSEALVSNADHRSALDEQAEVCGLERATSAVRSIDVALQQLDQNAQPRLVLEVMLLGWPTLRAIHV